MTGRRISFRLGEVVANWRDTDLADWRRALRGTGRSLLVTNGCFDLLGSHHVRLLTHMRLSYPKAMRIVCLNSDDSVARIKGTERPIIPFADRAYMLAALSSVDQVIGFDEDTPEELYAVLQPHVLCKGADAVRPYPGEQYASGILSAPSFPGSTTETIRRIFANVRNP